MSDVTISGLPAASAVVSTDVLPMDIASAGATQKATATQLVSSANAATAAGTNPALFGTATSANATRFPNAQAVISNTAAGIQQNESHNIGLMAEGVANGSDVNIYGVGVYGAGYTNGATRSGGVVGEGHVSATGDTGSSIGIRGYATQTHAGGYNIGLYGNASGGSANYALYMAGGDINSTTAQTWSLGGALTLSGGAIATPAYQLTSAGIITESTTSRTLSATDNGAVIYCTSASAVTITTATSLGAGFSCTIIQGGAGQITVAQGASTTLVSYGSLVKTAGQYALASIICPVANTFYLAGNLGA